MRCYEVGPFETAAMRVEILDFPARFL